MARTSGPMIEVMQATLLVLAGGESRRMGRPKAWLEVGETTLLRWMVERLGPAFSEVVVSFAEPEQLEELVPYRLVFDRKRASGPLAGIEAGLIAARHEVEFSIVIYVGCDDGWGHEAARRAPYRRLEGPITFPQKNGHRSD